MQERSAVQTRAPTGEGQHHRNEMAYRGGSVDALIKTVGAHIGGPDHDPTACEYLAAGRHEGAAVSCLCHADLVALRDGM